MSDQTPYTIRYSPKAESQLAHLDKQAARRIARKVVWLGDNAVNFQHEALRGQWTGAYRIRVGSYRVLYRLNHEMRIILVELIGHRRDVYRK